MLQTHRTHDAVAEPQTQRATVVQGTSGTEEETWKRVDTIR